MTHIASSAATPIAGCGRQLTRQMWFGLGGGDGLGDL